MEVPRRGKVTTKSGDYSAGHCLVGGTICLATDEGRKCWTLLATKSGKALTLVGVGGKNSLLHTYVTSDLSYD